MNRFVRQLFRARFVREEQGSVILETAIMLLLLLMFAFGIVDFGRVMYVSNSLTNATRDGARWTAVQSAVPTASAVQDTVRAHFNGFTFGGPSLTQGNVSVTLPSCSASPQVTTVTILTTYPFNWLTPLPRLMRWTTSSTPMTSNIHAKAIFKYEWCG